MQGGFEPHRLIAKLSSESDGVVELRGFIGPDEGDAVSLYTSLEMTEWFLVPREAILHVLEPEPERVNDQPTRVFVRRSAELRRISRRETTIRASAVSRSAESFDEAYSVCERFLWWCLGEAGSDFKKQISCFHTYAMCAERRQKMIEDWLIGLD